MTKFKLVLPAVLLAGSMLAAPHVMAQQPPPSGQTSRSAQMSPAEHAERHIARLHDQLKVTPEQEAQWKAVADVMRENAKTLHDLHVAKMAKVDNQTAIEDLASYRELAEAHYQAAKRLEEAFGTFYASLPPDQQKLADTVFRDHKHNMQHMQHGQRPKGAS